MRSFPRKDPIADALALSASCFVVPDILLLLAGRPDLLGFWARAAGPLALLGMLFILRRAHGSWPVVFRTTALLALPALLFVR